MSYFRDHKLIKTGGLQKWTPSLILDFFLMNMQMKMGCYEGNLDSADFSKRG